MLKEKIKHFCCSPKSYFVYYWKEIPKKWYDFCEGIRAIPLRKQIRDDSVTLFSNDCFGGFELHRLRMRFNSPTVNLRFPDRLEYIKYIAHIEEYSKSALIDDTEQNRTGQNRTEQNRTEQNRTEQKHSAWYFKTSGIRRCSYMLLAL